MRREIEEMGMNEKRKEESTTNFKKMDEKRKEESTTDFKKMAVKFFFIARSVLSSFLATGIATYDHLSNIREFLEYRSVLLSLAAKSLYQNRERGEKKITMNEC
jgi:hypothetical protein